MRIIRSSLILLLLVTGGCGGPRRAVLPPADAGMGEVPEDHRILSTGDFVEIELKSGGVVLGEVREATPDHVVLGRAGNFGYEEQSIRADEIKSIELNGGETTGSATLKVGRILLLVALVFAVAVAASGGLGGS